MRKRRFTEEQIIGVLKQAEGGMKVDEVCRQNGISRHTFYVWRKKFGGMDVSEAKRFVPSTRPEVPSCGCQRREGLEARARRDL